MFNLFSARDLPKQVVEILLKNRSPHSPTCTELRDRRNATTRCVACDDTVAAVRHVAGGIDLKGSCRRTHCRRYNRYGSADPPSRDGPRRQARAGIALEAAREGVEAGRLADEVRDGFDPRVGIGVALVDRAAERLADDLGPAVPG